jgi:hypothetical protein
VLPLYMEQMEAVVLSARLRIRVARELSERGWYCADGKPWGPGVKSNYLVSHRVHGIKQLVVALRIEGL